VEAQEKRRRRLAEDIRLTSGYAEHTERTVSRAEAPKLKRYAKKVAKKAKAREHRLRREMESADWVRAPRDPAAFVVRMEAEDPRGRLVAALRDVSVAGVLDRIDLTLHGRERVGLIGPNGGGKSTLLHVLAGVLAPDAGEVDVRAQVRLLPQTPVRLPAQRPLLAWFREQVVLPEDEARTLLAHYRLGAEAIGRPLGRLSPGERARVHVAAIVASGAELVLLDEPTNHLDFDTLEVIEAALRAYRGTLVVASHDYALLEAIGCERLVEVRDGVIANASAISS
jgi:ATPase subunit of ABC transporter with duplicated ATPase domains